jgi:hypothetical protein
MFPLPANIYFEIAAFAMSVILWQKIKHSELYRLPFFLLFIVLVELLGRYIYKVLQTPNGWLYNISVPIEYIFFASLFYQSFAKKNRKVAVKIFLWTFPVWMLIDSVLLKSFNNFNTDTLKIGSLAMIIICLMYFTELITADEIINPFKKPLFWIAVGLFLFNAGEFTLNMFSHILMKKWSVGKITFQKINGTLIFVLYSSIIIALIIAAWGQNRKVSTLPSTT